LSKFKPKFVIALAASGALTASLLVSAAPALAAKPTKDTAAFSCPSSIPEVKPGLTERKLPVPAASSVTHLTICHYAGLNLHHVKFGSLTKQIEVANPALYIKSFAGSTQIRDKQARFCTADDGGMDLLNIETTNKPVQLSVHMRGCQFVTSSYAAGSWFASLKAGDVLHRLDTQWLTEMKQAYGPNVQG
jgi:hypothetical protein